MTPKLSAEAAAQPYPQPEHKDYRLNQKPNTITDRMEINKQHIVAKTVWSNVSMAHAQGQQAKTIVDRVKKDLDFLDLSHKVFCAQREPFINEAKKEQSIQYAREQNVCAFYNETPCRLSDLKSPKEATEDVFKSICQVEKQKVEILKLLEMGSMAGF